MIKYLKLLSQFATRASDKLDSYITKYVQWTKLSQMRAALWVFAVFIIYTWVIAGLELLIWGETFEHFLDGIVLGVLGFFWISVIIEIQDIRTDILVSQRICVDKLYNIATTRNTPKTTSTSVTGLREAIQQAEQFNLLRLRTNDGNYHVVTGALVDADGMIILTE